MSICEGYILDLQRQPHLYAGRRKELENYCSWVLDEYEDDLIAALKKESGDLEGILCQQLSAACKSGSLTDIKAEL